MRPPDARDEQGAVDPAGEAAFSDAVLDPALPAPAGLLASRRPEDALRDAAVGKRFAVYRNNVVVSLIDMLAARFSASQRLLGRDFFQAMARAFVLSHPPRSKLLLAYGDDLPSFIGAFPPARSVPYMADVASLEMAVARAFHAADATPVAAAALGSLAPDALTRARLTLHPSLELVASRYPLVSLYERNLSDELAADNERSLDMRQGETALVLRPHLDVEVRRVPAGGGAFIGALAEGCRLGEAAASATTDGFDLAANIAALFGAGGVVAVEA